MFRRIQQGGTRRAARSGFSLVEILVVMALIGVLTSLVVGASFFAKGKAIRSNTTAEMERIKSALEEYRLEYGEYPDVNSFAEMTATNSYADLKAFMAYVDPHFVDLVDGWGNPFEYQRISKLQYRLMSHGPDGPAGDEEDDLTNYKGSQ